MNKEIRSEIICEVIRKLPENNLKNLLTINKDIYAFISAMLSFKTPLKITSKKINDQSVFNSMISTLRKFDTIIIKLYQFNDEELVKIQQIIDHHGCTIKHLELSFLCDQPQYPLKQSTLFSWISSMPVLESIKGSPSKCFEVIAADGYDSIIKLPKLQKLLEPPTVFLLKLHEIKDCHLSHLHLSSMDPIPNLSEIFKIHGQSLQVLTISSGQYFKYDPEPFRHLSLQEFTLYDSGRSNECQKNFLMDFLDHQTKLKKLQLRLTPIFDSSLYDKRILLKFILNMKELIELKIDIILLGSDFNSLLAACPKLEIINIKPSSDLISLSSSHLNLKKLNIDFIANPAREIAPEVIQKLPNLQKLTVDRMKYEFEFLRAVSRSKIKNLKISAHDIDGIAETDSSKRMQSSFC